MKGMISAGLENGAWSRRRFLKAASSLGLTAAGMALLEACGAKPAATGVGGTLETTTLRIPIFTNIGVCTAPLYMAEDFFRTEGFKTVEYVKAGQSLTVDTVASGATDITLQFSGPTILYLDTGKPVTMLAGVHVGCFVLFGSPHIKVLADLKGTTIAVSQLGGPDHVFLSSILATVSINPVSDVTWTAVPIPQMKQNFIDGKIDAMLALPTTVQDLRARQVGHEIVNSMVDKPWSRYFCCMVTVNQDFMRNNPVATKAALRSILKATDVCALQPERAAQAMVDKGFATDYHYALQAMQEIPYNRWRVYDPEDTVRFYALLLGGVGMVKSTPDALIAKGTDWHLLNELKAEMPVPANAAALSNTLFCAVDRGQTAGETRPRSVE
jgi:NitT/TauT family transport system substrate-binding protein